MIVIDDSHCNMIHSSLTAVHCFDSDDMGKQPVGWKEYCVKYWQIEAQETMNKCTGHCDITEIMLKMALNNIALQSRRKIVVILAISDLSSANFCHLVKG